MEGWDHDGGLTLMDREKRKPEIRSSVRSSAVVRRPYGVAGNGVGFRHLNEKREVSAEI